MPKLASLLAAAALVATVVLPAQAGPRQARGEARLAKLLDGREAGKPVDCIQLSSVSSTEIVDGTAIVYRVGSKLYVNRPDTGASSLRRDDVLFFSNHDSRLCSVDSVKLLDSGSHFQKGFVGLSKFVPYGRRAARG
ncbi:hypothetical protein EON82_25730 [bacterium]|nr:MAG: hypothetical protein EON82_25730 [bacterium]